MAEHKGIVAGPIPAVVEYFPVAVVLQHLWLNHNFRKT
jgi:hypothetical protein